MCLRKICKVRVGRMISEAIERPRNRGAEKVTVSSAPFEYERGVAQEAAGQRIAASSSSSMLRRRKVRGVVLHLED